MNNKALTSLLAEAKNVNKIVDSDLKCGTLFWMEKQRQS